MGKNRRKPAPSLAPARRVGLSFKHSGDLGDILFSLPTIKALGGGSLYLSQSETGFTREPMTETRAGFLAPLLACQPFLSKVEIYRGQAVAYDLDYFRRYWFSRPMPEQKWVTIADWHCRAFNVQAEVNESEWLTVHNPIRDVPVVINRTDRYHGRDFDWRRVVSFYGKKALFIGLPEEHSKFQAQFGQIRYRPVKDALEMARIIAGAELFIGNQSLPEAIAEGLKKAKILEVPVLPPTSLYPRAGAQYVFSPCMWLPDL